MSPKAEDKPGVPIMSTIMEDIERLQKQQAAIAVSAKETYSTLTHLLTEWEGLQDDVNQNIPSLQTVISREVEQQHKELLSGMKEWQELQLQIETIVENELQGIRKRVFRLKEVASQTSPPEKTEPDDDNDDDETRMLGIGA